MENTTNSATEIVEMRYEDSAIGIRQNYWILYTKNRDRLSWPYRKNKILLVINTTIFLMERKINMKYKSEKELQQAKEAVHECIKEYDERFR